MNATDLEVVARTVWGEARGEKRAGRTAVAWVIRNRVDSPVSWWGTDYHSVCLKPWQFSCWNLNDPNREKMEKVTADNPIFRECLKLSEGVISGEIPDPTGGATHYFSTSLPVDPQWAGHMRQTAKIGRHLFYKET